VEDDQCADGFRVKIELVVEIKIKLVVWISFIRN